MLGEWEMLNNLDPIVKNFIVSQLRNTGKQKYKKTYFEEGKLLVFEIYKRSPQTYRFLSRLFSLPSAV